MKLLFVLEIIMQIIVYQYVINLGVERQVFHYFLRVRFDFSNWFFKRGKSIVLSCIFKPLFMHKGF